MAINFGINVFGVGVDLCSATLWGNRPRVSFSSSLSLRLRTKEEIEEEKIEEERRKAYQEKLQAVLDKLSKDEANKYCAECEKKLGKFRSDVVK